MIDFHSHILYGIDDGSKDEAMTLDMLKTSAEEGVAYICATPHFIPEESEISKRTYNELFNKVTSLNSTAVKILSGIEIYMNPNLPELADEKKIWGINNGKYMLIELPMNSYPNCTDDVFYELQVRGVKPILAHPERNFYLQEHLDKMEELVKNGVLLQMNGGSLSGKFGAKPKEISHIMVKRNLIHLLGSDGHRNNMRTTHLKEAFDIVKELNSEAYQWIIDNEKNIVNSKDVTVLPVIKEEKKKKKWFKFW